jgi:hypothetical protein
LVTFEQEQKEHFTVAITDEKDNLSDDRDLTEIDVGFEEVTVEGDEQVGENGEYGRRGKDMVKRNMVMNTVRKDMARKDMVKKEMVRKKVVRKEVVRKEAVRKEAVGRKR